jgi:hypothetical protein
MVQAVIEFNSVRNPRQGVGVISVVARVGGQAWAIPRVYVLTSMTYARHCGQPLMWPVYLAYPTHVLSLMHTLVHWMDLNDFILVLT